MPIVSSQIIKSHDRGNGSQRVFEQHTDHNGDVHEHRYTCPLNHNINQALLDWQPILNTTLVNSEKESYQQAIEDGVDPNTITLKHLSNTQKARRVVRALMLGNPNKMLKAAQYVQGFTNAQIEKFFTVAQRKRIRVRQNYILNNQTVFSADVREEL